MVCDDLPEEHTFQDGSVYLTGCCCAIVGVEEGHIVYDYTLLVRHFYEHQGMVSEYDDIPEMGAIEWIDFNVIPALPMIEESIRPIIRYEEEK